MVGFDPKGRRLFLRDLGHLGLSLPFLPSLVPKAHAQSQESQVPVRVVFLVTLLGYDHKHWWKLGKEPYIPINEWSQKVPLSEMPGGRINDVHTNKFQKFYSKMNWIRGLDSGGQGKHVFTDALLCASSAYSPPEHYGASLFPDSVDSIIADNCYKSEPKTRALRIAVPIDNGHGPSHWSFKGGKVIPYIDNVKAAFNKMFDGAVGSDPQAQAAFEKLKAKQKSVIDGVLPAFNEVRKSRAISTDDKQTLEVFAERLAELQRKIESRAFVGCDKPSLGEAPTTANTPGLYHYINQTIISSFQCDLTRVAVVSLNHPDTNVITRSKWHLGTHGEYNNGVNLLKWDTFQANHIHDLIAGMDAVVESNGKTMLDNSIIMTSSEFGRGFSHTSVNFPVLTAGSAGGQVNTGFVLDYQQKSGRVFSNGKGGSKDASFPAGNCFLNNMMCDIMRTAGLNESHWEKNGAGKGYGTFEHATRQSTGAGTNNGLWATALSRPRSAGIPGFLKNGSTR